MSGTIPFDEDLDGASEALPHGHSDRDNPSIPPIPFGEDEDEDDVDLFLDDDDDGDDDVVNGLEDDEFDI